MDTFHVVKLFWHNAVDIYDGNIDQPDRPLAIQD